MNDRHLGCVWLGILSFVAPISAWADTPKQAPAETKLTTQQGIPLTVRMQGPYDADVPLQVVCYFKWTASGEKKLAGAPVELDKRLGGLIGSLRARGEFLGDDFETFLIDAPHGTIQPKRLLLIGLGDEASLSLEKMEKVGRIALREAVRLGANKVAFAPLIRDQGNVKYQTGDIEFAVTRGMLLAYHTEQRLQKQGFAKPYVLDQWLIEAGPTYYDETIAGVKKAIADAANVIKDRDEKPYSTLSK